VGRRCEPLPEVRTPSQRRIRLGMRPSVGRRASKEPCIITQIPRWHRVSPLPPRSNPGKRKLSISHPLRVFLRVFASPRRNGIWTTTGGKGVPSGPGAPKKNRIGSVPRLSGLNPMRLAQVGLEIQRRAIWLGSLGRFLVRSASYSPYQKRQTTTATGDPRRDRLKPFPQKNPSAATAKGRTVS
jgi:hypothetical protein